MPCGVATLFTSIGLQATLRMVAASLVLAMYVKPIQMLIAPAYFKLLFPIL
jgi:hypothetical protein